MKKYLFSMLAMAAVLFTACTQDDELRGNTAGDEVLATFTIDVPTGAETRAIGDGTTVSHVACAVYNADDEELTDLRIDDLEITDKKATYKIRLAKGQKYRVAFFAYNKEYNDYAGVYTLTDLKNITINTTQLSNIEAHDAFTNYVDVTADESMSPIKKEVILKRPFAQLNLGSLAADVEAAQKSGIDVVQTQVTVTNVYTAFSAFDNKVVGTPSTKTYTYNVLPTEKLTANGGTYDYLALNYLLVGDLTSEKSLHEVTFQWIADNGYTNDPVTVWDNVPMQRNYRTNILGWLLTNPAEFDIVVDEKFNEPDYDVLKVETSEQFEEAIRVNDEHIVINLEGSTIVTRADEAVSRVYDLNISAWVPEYYLGGENTKTITVNGYGATINFIHNNSDWNYIRLANPEAKLILNNVNLTNSGNNGGPWNRSFIRFFNEVELNDVNSAKSIAVLNDANLNNVNINVADGNYALWVTAQGQTVNVDGLNVVATNGGRGVKVADEYVDAPQLPILNLKNAKFETAKKAAVLVSSKAGAEINLANVDITKVYADGVNAVWVDEDWAEYADLVTVNGGTKVVEGNFIYVHNAEELAEALDTKQSAVIYFANNIAGDVTVLQKEGINLEINGGGKRFDGVFTVNGNARANGAETLLFENINFFTTSTKTFINAPSKIDNKYNYSHNVTINNCTFSVPAVMPDSYQKAGSASFTGTYNLVMTNCTAKNMHSLLQVQSCDNNVTVDNVTVENCKNGVSFGNTANPVLKNSTIDAVAYGVRGDGNASRGNLVIENTTINAEKPVIIRKVTTDGYSVALDNAELTPGILYHVVFTKGDDEAAFAAPEVAWSITGADDLYVFPNEIEDEEIAVATTSQIQTALDLGKDVTLTSNITVAAADAGSNAYGATGINVKTGQTIDGAGHSFGVNKWGTWDSAISTTGGVIKNITVNSGMRGIFVNHNSDESGKVILENVTIDGAIYTVSCDQGTNSGLEATGCTLNGWTSYAATIGDVLFTDCSFGEGQGYAYCRPYAPTTFVGCNFEAGFEMDPRAAVTFENCTIDGVALTSENLATLVTSNIANATVK